MFAYISSFTCIPKFSICRTLFSSAAWRPASVVIGSVTPAAMMTVTMTSIQNQRG